MQIFRLDGRSAIVTGGAHGIGRAICEVFAEAGARVLIADIDETAGEETAAMVRRTGAEILFCRADVSEEADAARAVRTAAERFGSVDVLCNNAAYLGQFHDALGATHEEWERSFRVSLLGAQHFAREALPLMIRENRGSIINIASVQALAGARESVAYTTIKSALLGFTRSLAYDFGARNIRANAICPGAIRTRISPPQDSELHRRQISKTFLERTGEPREVANAALFLASDAASYITGAVLAVDGGWTAM